MFSVSFFQVRCSSKHKWGQRLTCTYEPDTSHFCSAVATGRYADDLAQTTIARSSRRKLNDINKLTTSSLASALGRRALQLHRKKGGHIRALGQCYTLFGCPESHRGHNDDGTCGSMRCGPYTFAQDTKYYRSEAPYHFHWVVFQATVVGALSFGLEVAPPTDVDIRILHGCLASLLYKCLRAYRFEHGRIVANITKEKAMQLVDLRPHTMTLRVRRPLWLRKQLF